MATRAQSIANRIYDDFQPLANWVPTETSNTLTVDLPGFQREQLRVQLDDKSNILISGERPLVGNRWVRFRRDFRIPENSNIGEIRAKFENETLYVLFPQTITPASASDKPMPNPQTTEEPKAGQSDTNPAQPKPSPQVREETKAQDPERLTAQPKPTPQSRKDPKAQTSTTEPIQPKQNPQIQEEPKAQASQTTEKKMDERPKEHINGEQKEPIEKKNDANAYRSSNERNIVDDDETTREKHKDSVETRDGEKKEQMLKQIDGPQYVDGPKVVKKGPNGPITGAILGSSAQEGMGHVAGLISGLTEPKQLIVNMVVAFSVVVGLGAYVIYKFMPTGSSENEKM